MNSNDASVTTAYDSIDITATSEYEGRKPVTDCGPASGCCQCNNKGSCLRSMYVKAGNTCTNCLLLQQAHCMNNKHIRNKSLTSNTITINNEFTNLWPNLIANSTLAHANQITHLATSHAFTFSDKTVFNCKPVFDCCRCSDKSSCRHCRCVKVGTT